MAANLWNASESVRGLRFQGLLGLLKEASAEHVQA